MIKLQQLGGVEKLTEKVRKDVKALVSRGEDLYETGAFLLGSTDLQRRYDTWYDII